MTNKTNLSLTQNNANTDQIKSETTHILDLSPNISNLIQDGLKRRFHSDQIQESLVQQTIQSMHETGLRGRVKSRIEQNQKDFGLTGQILSSLSQNLG